MKFLYLSMLIFLACRTPNTNWAKECAERFPSRTDSVIYRTETIKHDTFVSENPQTVYLDTTLCPPSAEAKIIVKTQYLNCPPQLSIVKTRILHDSIVIFRANVAAENDLKSQLSGIGLENLSLKSQVIKAKKQRRIAVWFAALGWLLLALFAFGTLKIWQSNR